MLKPAIDAISAARITSTADTTAFFTAAPISRPTIRNSINDIIDAGTKGMMVSISSCDIGQIAIYLVKCRTVIH